MNTFTNTIAAAVSAVALTTAAPMPANAAWTYDTAAGTITDGSWTLKVTVVDAATHTLAVGDGTGTARNAIVSGCGDLALSGEISDGTYVWTLGALKRYALGSNSDNLILTNLTVSAPHLTTIEDCALARNVALTNAVFNVPNLRSLGANGFGRTSATMPVVADIAQLCPPGTTNVGDAALASCQNVYGNLVLTNLVSLGSGGHQFDHCYKLTRIDLKGPLQAVPVACFFGNLSAQTGAGDVILDCPALTNIGSQAFQAMQNYGMEMSNLVIGAKGPVVIANDAFTCKYYGQATGKADALTSVTFYGPAPDAASLTNLMVRVSTNNSTHTCTIHASVRQAGWLEIAAAPNTAEALNAPKGCFGVYTNSAGRKAWLVNRKSPYDSKVPGFSIRICDNDIGISYDRLSEAPARRLPVRGRM